MNGTIRQYLDDAKLSLDLVQVEMKRLIDPETRARIWQKEKSGAIINMGECWNEEFWSQGNGTKLELLMMARIHGALGEIRALLALVENMAHAAQPPESRDPDRLKLGKARRTHGS